MGRDQAPLATRTAIRAWAEASLASSGLNRKQMAAYFRSADGKPSTTFYACLREGRSFPRLQLDTGELGPALSIEADYPGTLKWLLHPMWQIAALCPEITVAEVRMRAAVLNPDVRRLLFDGPTDRLRRNAAVSSRLCSALAKIGSLDALAAVFYLGLEACTLEDPRGILIARRAIERLTEGWICLQPLSSTTRRWIEGALVRALDSFDVDDGFIDTSVASLFVAAETCSQHLPRGSTGALMIRPDAYEWLAERLTAQEATPDTRACRDT